jgi:hypothetical protein
MNFKQMVGFVGSFILFIGVFAPIVSVPVVGDTSYFQGSGRYGYIMLALAILSGVLLIFRWYGGLWLSGLGSLGILALTFFHFETRATAMDSDMVSYIKSIPSLLGEGPVDSVQLQWGWVLLLVGAGLVLIAAVIRDGGEPGH